MTAQNIEVKVWVFSEDDLFRPFHGHEEEDLADRFELRHLRGCLLVHGPPFFTKVSHDVKEFDIIFAKLLDTRLEGGVLSVEVGLFDSTVGSKLVQLRQRLYVSGQSLVQLLRLLRQDQFGLFQLTVEVVHFSSGNLGGAVPSRASNFNFSLSLDQFSFSLAI